MSRATLLALGPRSLYLGPAFGLSAHTNAVSVLACGLDGPFHAVAGHPPAGEDGPACRCAFIPAHTLVRLACGRTRMAFLYVDALGLDDQRLRALSGLGSGAIALGLPVEDALITLLQRLDRAGTGAAGGADWSALLDLLQIHHEQQGDERILRSVAQLAREPAAACSLAALAAGVNLSRSRYLHLFKQATGVPLRRYRLWLRIGAAVRGMASGQNLTAAALDAGFSSSAHFSFVFRVMFGMAPSTLAGAGITYHRLPAHG